MSEQPSTAPVLELATDPEHIILTSFERLIEKHMLPIMAVLGIIQVMFAVFSVFERMNPTVDSRYIIVDTFIDNKIWAGIFFVLGLVTIVAVRRAEVRVLATALTCAGLSIWGVLCIVKSVTAVQPVAWSVGVAVGTLGFVAYKLCLIWATLLFDPSKVK